MDKQGRPRRQPKPSQWEMKLDTLLGSIRSDASKSDIKTSGSDPNGTSKRRSPPVVKMNKALQPPCKPQKVDPSHSKGMHGSIEHVSAVGDDTATDISGHTDASPVSYLGNPEKCSLRRSNAIKRRKGMSPLTVSDSSTLATSSASSLQSSGLVSGKLPLSQRLQTMDVRETVVYLHKQGYTATFIAEHLSVRGYSQESGMYRKYDEEWVQEYLNKTKK